MTTRKVMTRLLRDTNGNFAIMSAILMLPLLLMVGSAVDYSTAQKQRRDIQSAADSAVLAAAANYSEDAGVDALTQQIDSYLAGNAEGSVKRLSDPTLSASGTEMCISAGEDVQTSFMKLAGVQTVPVSVTACSALPGQINLEVSLVLDVSSSMVEQKRYTQMQAAVKTFITAFSNNSSVASRTKIAIVPFSSRVNIGMNHTDWLRAYNGNPAVPTRWSKPKSVYTDSKYSFSQWVDNVTPLVYTSSNNYWIGCVEPRADVEVKESGAIGAYGLSDVPPSTVAFVPMDSNPGSSTSFCPPPITPLTNDFNYLQQAVASMTSEGSTRLDAGILAGWYTLSPNWRAAWGGAAPVDYSTKVRKVLVFMTDGQMNVKYGPGDNDKLDWLCEKNRTSACNDIATNAFLSTCATLKSNNIDVYAISYSSEADVSNLKNCSSGPAYYFSASATNVSQVYTAISKNIVGSTVRLTR
jgi:Flp pilus assembly protein TadG